VVQAEEKRLAPGTVTERRTMTGGEALVESLIAQGIDQIFGLPGVQLDGAFDALHARTDRIGVLHVRHEQAAAYMADGYASVNGQVGTAMVVPGPGLLNAAAALSTAYATNVPVLCVTGQIQSDMIEFGRGLLHEIPNQLGMIRSVTKWAGRAVTPEEIPALVNRAFIELKSGRPRPVEIEIPPDTLFAVADVDLLAPAGEPERPAGDPELVEQAAKLLAGAKKPVICAGGGVIRSAAWDELKQIAEALGAPVMMTANGKGGLSDRHPLAMNTVWGIGNLKDADVILAVGTRFVDPATAPWGIGGQDRPVVQLDIDPEELSRNHPATVAINADAKAGLAALRAHLGSLPLSGDWDADELARSKEAALAKAMAVGPQAEYAMAIRRALPDNGVFVSEVTQVGYWSNFALPIYEPRTFVGTGYQGTLGFGFPTSLGAKIAAGDRPVVSINGDGGFGFCLNELATMAQHQIGTVVVVFNDGAFGNVRRIQNEQFGGRTIASDLRNPDYLQLAKAFGVTGRRAGSPADLEREVTASIAANEPTLIEVPMKPVPNPWKALGYR
jgi:acetolactate synthase I/II/III large subunit